MTTTDIAPYAGNGQLGQYQAGAIMTPEDAKALDEQVRRCTEAVLREGTDYGIIPGTGGDKTLWRPGAQKLLQWFGLSFSCERVEIERDDQGRKHGITYRATVARRMPDGSLDIKATCEGTADYDESRFYQSEEEVKAKIKERETRNAEKYNRPRNPDKWNNATEYRADWNALMKRAQKRAIVGAVVDATAAGGIFSDREEDDRAAPQDDEATWYEQAIEHAHTFTDIDDGRALYLAATEAHKNGLCLRRHQDHVQNTIVKRVKKLQAAAPVVQVEDLAAKAEAEDAQDAAEDTQDDEGRDGDDDSEPPQDTLPVEEPPDWPEVTKPGTGKPKGK